MNSKMLESLGLKNYISGPDYRLGERVPRDEGRRNIYSALGDMGENPIEIYSGVQVHGHNIEYCDGMNGEENFYGRVFPDTDGLITDKKDIALVIKFADCTPILLFDPVKRVQVAIHSGWRSTVQRISQRGIDRMIRDFGCNIEDIHAYLGPSIDMANYEVDTDVYDAFRIFESRDQFFQIVGNKFILSMIDSNLSLLLESGINPSNIEVSRISTFEDERFSSARRDKGKYKLNFMISIIKWQIIFFKIPKIILNRKTIKRLYKKLGK